MLTGSTFPVATASFALALFNFGGIAGCGGRMGDRSVRIPRRDVELYRSGRAGRGLDVGDAIHTGQSGDAAALGSGAASLFGVIAACLSLKLLALPLLNRHSKSVSMQS